MPGIAIIGDSRNAARHRPTSLPAEARSLSRMLRLLKSPDTASKALAESLSKLPLPSDCGERAALKRVQRQVSLAVADMKEAGWDSFADRMPEYNLALAVESVLQDSSCFQPTTPTKQSAKRQPPMAACSPSTTVDESSSQGSSHVIPTNTSATRASDSISLLELPAKQQDGPQSTKPTTQTQIRRSPVALVSDTSSVEEDSVATTLVGNVAAAEAQVASAKGDALDELQAAKSARHLWALILESVHLQVASRTTTVWGKKKIYEVYQLARPVQDLSAREEPMIRKRLEMESRSVLDGVLLDSGYCRVYTTLQPLAGLDRSVQALNVQINLGKIYDLQDESNRGPSGEKKKKNESEFVAILVPGSRLLALTASRAASRSRYTPYVLALLENVLTATTNNCAAMKATKKADLEDSIASKRFQDLSGTEPHELLRAARAVAVGEATGRFSLMASKDQSNPVNDLQTAASGNLLIPTDAAENTADKLQTTTCLGNSKVARVAARVEKESNGAVSVVAATRDGGNLCLDHSAREKISRKRTREEALGRSKDCPQLQRLCWKWSGETTAASACWLDEDDEKATKQLKSLPKTEFKCAVVMKGENVLQGIQALVDSGLMEAPLPDFIRDAPSLGGTIRVDHGSFVGADAAVEEG